MLEVAKKIVENCPSEFNTLTEQCQVVSQYNLLMVGAAEAFHAPPSPIFFTNAGDSDVPFKLCLSLGYETINAKLEGNLLKMKEGGGRLQSAVWNTTSKLIGYELLEASFILNGHPPEDYTHKGGAGGVHSNDPAYDIALEDAFLSLDQILRDFSLQLAAKLVGSSGTLAPLSYEATTYYCSLTENCKGDQKKLMEERKAKVVVAHPCHLNSGFAKLEKFKEWDALVSEISGFPSTAAVDFFKDNGMEGLLATKHQYRADALRSHLAERLEEHGHSGYVVGDEVKNFTGDPNGKARSKMLTDLGRDPTKRQATATNGQMVLPGSSNNKKRKATMTALGLDHNLAKPSKQYKQSKQSTPKPSNSVDGRNMQVYLTLTRNGKMHTVDRPYFPGIHSKGAVINLPAKRYGVDLARISINIPTAIIKSAKKEETLVWTHETNKLGEPELASMEIKLVELGDK